MSCPPTEYAVTIGDVEFKAVATSKPTRPGAWNGHDVEVFRNGKKIGQYFYNYSSFHRTFYPFIQDGHEYALVAMNYTCSSVIDLQDSCKKIADEGPNSFGFCPVEFYVPPEAKGRFGFVSGCVWGDDHSWKIEFVDLRNITKGILKVDSRFGYIEIPSNQTLEQSILYVDPEVGDPADPENYSPAYVKINADTLHEIEFDKYKIKCGISDCKEEFSSNTERTKHIDTHFPKGGS